MSKRVSIPYGNSMTKKAKSINLTLDRPSNDISSINKSNITKYKIFVDLDGVLVDFEGGVRKLFPNFNSSSEIPPKRLWSRVATEPNFFANLQWTNDGQLLWNTLLDNCSLHKSDARFDVPDVLTGIPMNKAARSQKYTWCRRQLARSNIQISHADYAAPKQEHRCIAGQRLSNHNRVNVITCWSRNKHLESKAQCILIDDRGDHKNLRENWEAKGGIFIQHNDTETTIQKLVDIGVIDKSSANSQVEKSKLVEVESSVERKPQHVIELLDDSD